MKLRTFKRIVDYAKAQKYLEDREKIDAYFKDHNELGQKKSEEKPESK